MKSLARILTVGFLWLTATLRAQTSIPLWPEGAPGAMGKEEKDMPTLTAFLPEPDASTGGAMLVFPGGGYGGLMDYEGADYAKWLARYGVASFVVKYRLGTHGYRHPAMLQDAARAIRLVRARAEEWKIDPKRVGVIGSSAGGHLASTLATHFDAGKSESRDPIERQSSRPDLAVLCYPVISMGTNGHDGSRKNLLGENPSPELVKQLSSELQVTAGTPPCFIFHTWEDRTVRVENALDFASALRRAGVPFDLHVYQYGAHGLALRSAHPWTNDCIVWLRAQKFVK